MQTINSTLQPQNISTTDATEKIKNSSYRGFVSIDQEMEREIAMQFFHPQTKMGFAEKSFLSVKF